MRKSAGRLLSADLVTRVAVVIHQCGEETLLNKLGLVLVEQLGEEYPDTLGSIISALGAVAKVVGMTQLSPPVKDLRECLILPSPLYTNKVLTALCPSECLVPRLTPILRNRHEKVQEATINLIGRIADRGAEFVRMGAKEETPLTDERTSVCSISTGAVVHRVLTTWMIVNDGVEDGSI